MTPQPDRQPAGRAGGGVHRAVFLAAAGTGGAERAWVAASVGLAVAGAPGSFLGVGAFLRRTDIRRQRGLRLAAVLLLVAGLSIGWSTSFRYSNLRSGGASWSRTYAGLGSALDVASSAPGMIAG